MFTIHKVVFCPLVILFLTEARAQNQRDENPVIFPTLNEEEIDKRITYYLYTRDNQDVPDVIIPGNTTSLEASHFSFRRPTKVVIHGYVDSSRGILLPMLISSTLNVMDANVIAVDWGRIAISVNYILAARRTYEVGADLAELIDFITVNGYNLDFHLIGHSLGSHVSGAAGRMVQRGNVSRISGLDPALPGFRRDLQIVPRLGRINGTFVDCLHTCGGFLGIFDPICDVDFYPNGGYHPQPACLAVDLGICSHFRAVRYYAESIYPNHKFPALRCNSPYDKPSECSRSSVLMGYPANPSDRGIYYVSTKSEPPFAPIVKYWGQT